MLDKSQTYVHRSLRQSDATCYAKFDRIFRLEPKCHKGINGLDLAQDESRRTHRVKVKDDGEAELIWALLNDHATKANAIPPHETLPAENVTIGTPLPFPFPFPIRIPLPCKHRVENCLLEWVGAGAPVDEEGGETDSLNDLSED